MARGDGDHSGGARRRVGGEAGGEATRTEVWPKRRQRAGDGSARHVCGGVSETECMSPHVSACATPPPKM